MEIPNIAPRPRTLAVNKQKSTFKLLGASIFASAIFLVAVPAAPAFAAIDYYSTHGCKVGETDNYNSVTKISHCLGIILSKNTQAGDAGGVGGEGAGGG